MKKKYNIKLYKYDNDRFYLGVIQNSYKPNEFFPKQIEVVFEIIKENGNITSRLYGIEGYPKINQIAECRDKAIEFINELMLERDYTE